LYIYWSAESVDFPSNSPSARWQGHRFFFTPGVTWSAVANHVALKSRWQNPCIFDADSMRLTPVGKTFDARAFLAVFNSDIFSFLKMKFIKHTQKWEIGDLRQMPLVMPTRPQERQLKTLAELCLEAKRLALDAKPATQELAATARQWIGELRAAAPQYLQPPAQACTLQSPEDCLAVFELAVNWHAEKLYGVEGLGPFDEF